MEDISHAHIVSLMYKLLTSSEDSNDLFIGFDQSRNRREELAANKNVKGKFNLKILLKDVCGFAACQEKATYGLGYKLTLTRNKDDAVIDRAGVLLMLELKMIISIGMYPIIHLPFINKVFCQVKF